MYLCVFGLSPGWEQSVYVRRGSGGIHEGGGGGNSVFIAHMCVIETKDR